MCGLIPLGNIFLRKLFEALYYMFNLEMYVSLLSLSFLACKVISVVVHMYDATQKCSTVLNGHQPSSCILWMEEEKRTPQSSTPLSPTAPGGQWPTSCPCRSPTPGGRHRSWTASTASGHWLDFVPPSLGSSAGQGGWSATPSTACVHWPSPGSSPSGDRRNVMLVTTKTGTKHFGNFIQ